MNKYRIPYSLHENCLDVAVSDEKLDQITHDRFARAKYEDVLIAQLHNEISFDECINRVVVQIVDDLIARVEEEM
jgi:hypothetical protein